MPFASWLDDLVGRVAFFRSWLQHGQPAVVQMPAFFFVQGFLSSVLQEHARKHSVPIDALDFDFTFHSRLPSAPAPDGVYMHGLHLEHARMGEEEGELTLTEPLPRQPVAPMVCVLFKPSLSGEIMQFKHYSCPIFRTSERYGQLATTGHSTNFIQNVRIPTTKSPAHWILRSVALISSLPD